MGEPRSWLESETTCGLYGGHLAVLDSFEELNLTRYLCNGTTSSCWVGGRAVSSGDSFEWKWSDNSSNWNLPFFKEASLQSNCSNKSCHLNISADSCILVANRSSTLVVERCNQLHPSICMIETGIFFSPRFVCIFSQSAKLSEKVKKKNTFHEEKKSD